MKLKTWRVWNTWCAVDDNTYDGPGSPVGLGDTEQEAIDELKQMLEDRDERMSTLP